MGMTQSLQAMSHELQSGARSAGQAPAPHAVSVRCAVGPGTFASLAQTPDSWHAPCLTRINSSSPRGKIDDIESDTTHFLRVLLAAGGCGQPWPRPDCLEQPETLRLAGLARAGDRRILLHRRRRPRRDGVVQVLLGRGDGPPDCCLASDG